MKDKMEISLEQYTNAKKIVRLYEKQKSKKNASFSSVFHIPEELINLTLSEFLTLSAPLMPYRMLRGLVGSYNARRYVENTFEVEDFQIEHFLVLKMSELNENKYLSIREIGKKSWVDLCNICDKVAKEI